MSLSTLGSSAAAPTDARGGGRRLRRGWSQYLAISPYYLLFLAFSLIPVTFSMSLAFTRWDGLSPIKFAGFDQFRLLFQDRLFFKSIGNTFILWLMSTVPTLVGALVIAAMLRSVRRFRLLYQAILFLPSITSIVAVVVFFKALFDQGYGVVNMAMAAIGLPEVAWSQDPWAIKVVLSLLIIWQWIGYNSIIYSAGLSAIPQELYEAAEVDGAGAWSRFWHVTVPMLRPVILFTVVMATITGMQTFTEPQVWFASNSGSTNANGGGPDNAALTMVLYFFQQAFNNNNYGYGSAILWAVLVIVGAFTVINWTIVGRSERD